MVAIAGETRLVTTAARAECFLRGHVADRIVGQRDREGEGKLAAGLQIQAELAKVLRGTGQEHGWPNLHRLHLDLNVRRTGGPGIKEHGLLGEDPCRFIAGSGILFDDLQSFGQMFGRRRPALDPQQPGLRGQRPERFGPLLDLQQNLHRRGADASPHESRGDLAELLDLLGIAVVHLGDVARRPRQKNHHGLIAHDPPDRLLQVINVVGGDSSRSGRGMAGEVDDAAQELDPQDSRLPARRPADRSVPRVR